MDFQKMTKQQLKEYRELELKKSIFREQQMGLEIEREDFLNELKVHYINRIAQKVKENWRYLYAKDNWGCDIYIKIK